MKTYTILLAVGMISCTVFADNLQEPGGGTNKEQLKTEVRDKFDADGDGKLNQDERKALGAAIKARKGKKGGGLGRNGNGGPQGRNGAGGGLGRNGNGGPQGRNGAGGKGGKNGAGRNAQGGARGKVK